MCFPLTPALRVYLIQHLYSSFAAFFFFFQNVSHLIRTYQVLPNIKKSRFLNTKLILNKNGQFKSDTVWVANPVSSPANRSSATLLVLIQLVNYTFWTEVMYRSQHCFISQKQLNKFKIRSTFVDISYALIILKLIPSTFLYIAVLCQNQTSNQTPKYKLVHFYMVHFYMVTLDKSSPVTFGNIVNTFLSSLQRIQIRIIVVLKISLQQLQQKKHKIHKYTANEKRNIKLSMAFA